MFGKTMRLIVALAALLLAFRAEAAPRDLAQLTLPNPINKGLFAPAVFFNGSATSCSNATTGPTDASTGAMSQWFLVTGSAGTTRTLLAAYTGTQNRVLVQLRTSNDLIAGFANSAFSASANRVSAVTFSVGSLYHLFMVWDMNAAAGSKTIDIYINGTLQNGAKTDASAAFNVGYSGRTWCIGREGAAAVNRMVGCVSETWFATSSTGLTAASFAIGGKPISLGGRGEYPLGGTVPFAYFNSSAGSYGVNSADNTYAFSPVSGDQQVTQCPTSPTSSLNLHIARGSNEDDDFSRGHRGDLAQLFRLGSATARIDAALDARGNRADR